MTDGKKHDDKDRKKLSDEEMEDVAGGATAGAEVALSGDISDGISKGGGGGKGGGTRKGRTNPFKDSRG